MVRVSRRVGKNHFDKIAQGPSSRPTPGLHAPPRKASHTASDIRPLHLVLLPSTNLPAFADPPVSSPIIHFYRVRLNDFKSFDALSKVLFIFPSQYLFAIGLLRLFSLRRSLSPALCTSIKVHDSLTCNLTSSKHRRRGSHPLWRPPRRHFCVWTFGSATCLQITIRRPKDGDYHCGLFPLPSPVLGESLLVSFPPLNDMLKFSGWSYFTSGAEKI